MLVGTINPPTWLDTRDEVFWPLESAGYPGNVWATWLRDLIVDFGYSGALLFVFCFGALLAFARNRFDKTGSAMWHNLEVIGVLTLVFAPFQNMLWYTQVADAFFFAIIALVLVRVPRLEHASPPLHHRRVDERRPDEPWQADSEPHEVVFPEDGDFRYPERRQSKRPALPGALRGTMRVRRGGPFGGRRPGRVKRRLSKIRAGSNDRFVQRHRDSEWKEKCQPPCRGWFGKERLRQPEQRGEEDAEPTLARRFCNDRQFLRY